LEKKTFIRKPHPPGKYPISLRLQKGKKKSLFHQTDVRGLENFEEKGKLGDREFHAGRGRKRRPIVRMKRSLGPSLFKKEKRGKLSADAKPGKIRREKKSKREKKRAAGKRRERGPVLS